MIPWNVYRRFKCEIALWLFTLPGVYFIKCVDINLFSFAQEKKKKSKEAND